MGKYASVFMGLMTVSAALFVGIALATPIYNLSPAPFIGVLTLMVIGGLGFVLSLLRAEKHNV